MKGQLKKEQLVEWLVKFHNNCGQTDYFGYNMSIEVFEKEMNKKTKAELEQLIFDTSDEGEQFLKEHDPRYL